MAWLTWQLLVPLILAGVFGGGLAGWSWHCIRTRDDWAKKDAERDRLRNELLAYVGVHTPGAPPAMAHVDNAHEQLLQAQRELFQRDEIVTAQRARISELEMALSAAQQTLRDNGDPAPDEVRLGALEAALREAQARATDLDARANALQTALDNASAAAGPPVDVAAMRWRMRELEARLAQHDASNGISRVAATPEPGERPDLEDIVQRQHWQTRYLNARVRYLEDQAKAPAPEPVATAPAAPVDAEAENRRRWRQRYLEARVAWLEGRARDNADARTRLAADVAARDERIAAFADAPPTDDRTGELSQRVAELEGSLAAARAETTHAGKRVADLEAGIAGRDARIALLQQAAPAAPADDTDSARLRWRSRYLDSRVRYLEQTLAASPAAPSLPPAAPRDDTFTPIAPQGSEVRPDGLPAPRGGAPDDLRLIAGVTPRIESTLNSLGIYHFDQIAAWSGANIDWLERYLAFKGRIGREDWVAQARKLGEMALT